MTIRDLPYLLRPLAGAATLGHMNPQIKTTVGTIRSRETVLASAARLELGISSEPDLRPECRTR